EAAYRRSHEFGSRDSRWPYPSAEQARACERLSELDAKLPKILAGEESEADATERAEGALFCLQRKQLHVVAARLFAEAFAAQPSLTDDVKKGLRFNAACAAALAGGGRGRDAQGLTEDDRRRWRNQALVWLRGELMLVRKHMETGGKDARAESAQILAH